MAYQSGYSEVSQIMKSCRRLSRIEDTLEKVMAGNYSEDWLEHGPTGVGNMGISRLKPMQGPTLMRCVS